VLCIHLAYFGVGYSPLADVSGGELDHWLRHVNADDMPMWPHLFSRRKEHRASTCRNIQHLRATRKLGQLHQPAAEVCEGVRPHPVIGGCCSAKEACYQLFVCMRRIAHDDFPLCVNVPNTSTRPTSFGGSINAASRHACKAI
jgi:hypothetical protein